ncbi:Ferric siderophore transport system, periplasmic binding protein TonB [hydrothermal vent metagenome]|uniref:Ferric siderophore transport system, periplasmic binding protein TonB n=1 Tax=hydrothermal vent metagenome TaxID=652676 RepID=A0A1W1EI67_9ZZZZ
MNRYISSFFITILLYSTLIMGYLYYLDTPIMIKTQPKKSQEIVKFRVVKEEKIEVEKEKVEPEAVIKEEIITPKIPIPIPIPKPSEKIKPIKDINKTVEPKKIVKKKLIKKKFKKKKHKRKKYIKKSKVKKRAVNRTKIRRNSSKAKKGVATNNSKKRQIERKYLNRVKNAINRNKSYPSKAKRRGVEGSVKVRVVLSSKGKLISYKIVSGNKLFKKSVKKAIKNSFPLLPPKGIFSSNIKFTFTLKYKLY